MRTPTILLSIALSLCLAGTAGAATYYVATTGSNSNSGTFSSPFLTVQHGVNQLANPGDELYVRGGTYTETVVIWDKHGSSTSPIYVRGYPNETAVINGNNTDANVVVISDSSYIRFQDFEVKNGGRAGILVWESEYVKVRWNDVHSNQKFGIHASCDTVGLTHHVTIEGNWVHNNVLNNIAHSESSGWTQAIGSFQSNDIEIIDNYVNENHGEGIDIVVGDRGLIARNTVADNFSANIYVDNAQDIVIDRNFVITGYADEPEDFYRGGSPAHGIAAANEDYPTDNPLDDLTITNNIVAWCKSGFLYGDWDNGGGLHNTLIANNTFYQTTEALLWIDDDNHDTTVVSNNIFRAASGEDYAWAPTTGFTYRTNSWYGGNNGTSKSGTGDVTSNPLLVNPSGGTAVDFKLQSTSPCKNAGTTESAVTTDHWGTARSGTYDIGAHEY